MKEILNNTKARLATLTHNSQMDQIPVNLLWGRERGGHNMRRKSRQTLRPEERRRG